MFASAWKMPVTATNKWCNFNMVMRNSVKLFADGNIITYDIRYHMYLQIFEAQGTYHACITLFNHVKFKKTF